MFCKSFAAPSATAWRTYGGPSGRVATVLTPLDPHRPISRVRGRRLPHWAQEGSAVFFTFRLADALPAVLLRRWERWRHRLLLRHGVDPQAIQWQNRLRDASPEAASRFQRRRSLAMLAAMDRGHGACVLRNPWASKVVLEALLHHNGSKLDVAAAVVMPNHAHGVAAARPGHDLRQTLTQARRYAAGRINTRLGRSGSLWQREGFDRLIRNAEAYERALRYIRDNPKRLPAGSFRLWEAP